MSSPGRQVRNPTRARARGILCQGLLARVLGGAVALGNAAVLLGGAAVGLADAALIAGITPARAAEAAPDPQVTRNWQLLGDYCEKCHNVTDWTGGIAFETLQSDSVGADAKVWEAAVRKLRGRMMPPPGQKQPDQASIDAFVAWMQRSLDRAAASAPDPGYVTLHRLNRTEYARAVQQLLDVQVDPSALLPKDVKSDGFDDIANVLKVSPTFLDQYISAARSVAAQAVGNAHAVRAIATYRAGKEDQAFHIEGLPLGTRGGMLVTHDFPADGDYDFSINVFGGVGYIIGLDEPHRVILTIDNQRVFSTSMGGDADLRAADQHPNEFAKELKERFAHIRVHVPAGPHQIGVSFIERSRAESDEGLQPLNPLGGEDRYPRIGGIELNGPFDASGVADTPSRQRIFTCHPLKESDELPCARQILAQLTRLAFRRPITEDDLGAPLHFFSVGRITGGSFDAGIENAIVAILASPKFLYRVEAAPSTVKVGGIYHISDVDLASRLSFFLWSEGPDAQLLDLAAANELHEPAVLEAQVRRMLADPRSMSLVTDFAFQWLQVDSMDKIEPDPFEYPNFDEDLRSAFRTEMKLFVNSILRQDRDVRELMTANWTYVNERLAEHYGIANVRGAQFRRVTLTDSHRFGLLGKGAILMGTSYANRTAPVLRGAWVLESITGTPPHAPPPAVPALKENVPGAKQLTIRERMEQHRTNPSCAACHGVMDPIGLALENFDAMGGWQVKDRDAGQPIDASGRMADGTQVTGPDALRNALMARPQQFVQTLTEKLMTFALGRTMEWYDMPTVRAIVRRAAQDDYRFSSIVLGVVESAPFLEKRMPGGEGNPHQMTTQAALAPARAAGQVPSSPAGQAPLSAAATGR